MSCDELIRLADPTVGDLDELAVRYRDARMWARDLTIAADAIELELAARMESDERVVSGVGVLLRRLDKRSTWKDEYAANDFRRSVGKAIVNKIALDLATGEYDQIKRNIANATIETVFDVIPAFSSIKRPGYRLGIDPEDFRTISEVYRVTIDDGYGEAP